MFITFIQIFSYKTDFDKLKMGRESTVQRVSSDRENHKAETYRYPACAFSMKIQPEKTKISQAIPHLSA